VPQIHKEWMCALRGNFFGAPLLTLVLFAMLVAPHSLPFAKALFWTGAPATMLLSIIRVSGAAGLGGWGKDLANLRGTSTSSSAAAGLIHKQPASAA
jgi:hypothetical protein